MFKHLLVLTEPIKRNVTEVGTQGLLRVVTPILKNILMYPNFSYANFFEHRSLRRVLQSMNLKSHASHIHRIYTNELVGI